MRKKDLTVPALLLEAVSLILALVYIGLQIFYGAYYHRSVTTILMNSVVMLCIYGVLTLLSIYPEWVNRIRPELCTGQVRKLTLRMLRLEKLVFMVGLFVPCIFDVVGIELPPASSVVLVVLLIAIAVFYEVRIYKKLKERD